MEKVEEKNELDDIYSSVKINIILSGKSNNSEIKNLFKMIFVSKLKILILIIIVVSWYKNIINDFYLNNYCENKSLY